MTCIRCKHDTARRFGYYGKRHIQRYRCTDCRATFADPNPRLASHYIDTETAAKALSLMLEGMSVRATSRLTGLHKDTVLSLMNTAAQKARTVFDKYVFNIRPRFVQADEIWTFVHCKDKAIPAQPSPEWGSAYVWLAMDSDTKLMLSYHVGDRNTVNAFEFIRDLSERTCRSFQITTDSLRSYVNAINEYLPDADFAQLHKLYNRSIAKAVTGDWYAGGKVVAAVPRAINGNPDMRRVSTSHMERANLSVRMHLRRFTRLTNAFSKKLDNLKAAVALYVCFYNFCRVHQTLRVTPAIEAGLTDHIWSVAELLAH